MCWGAGKQICFEHMFKMIPAVCALLIYSLNSVHLIALVCVTIGIRKLCLEIGCVGDVASNVLQKNNQKRVPAALGPRSCYGVSCLLCMGLKLHPKRFTAMQVGNRIVASMSYLTFRINTNIQYKVANICIYIYIYIYIFCRWR